MINNLTIDNKIMSTANNLSYRLENFILETILFKMVHGKTKLASYKI